jgi:hypothetical protein
VKRSHRPTYPCFESGPEKQQFDVTPVFQPTRVRRQNGQPCRCRELTSMCWRSAKPPPPPGGRNSSTSGIDASVEHGSSTIRGRRWTSGETAGIPVDGRRAVLGLAHSLSRSRVWADMMRPGSTTHGISRYWAPTPPPALGWNARANSRVLYMSIRHKSLLVL